MGDELTPEELDKQRREFEASMREMMGPIYRLHSIEKDLLSLFRQSIGMRFRLKGGIQGVPLEDEVIGVDDELFHVKGKEYGNFHVSLCELIP